MIIKSFFSDFTIQNWENLSKVMEIDDFKAFLVSGNNEHIYQLSFVIYQKRKVPHPIKISGL